MQISGVTPRPDLSLMIQQEVTLLDNYIAHRIMPIYSVGISTGPIPKIHARRRVERLYTPRYGAFPRGELSVSAGETFNCQRSGFEEPLDDKDSEVLKGEENAKAVAALKAADTVLLAREYGVAQSLMTTSTFGSGYNTAATATWGTSGAKPIEDIAAAMEKVRQRIGVPANTMVISYTDYLKLCASAQVQSQVRAILGYTDKQGGIAHHVAADTLAAVFGLQEVLIAPSVYDSADEGQTASHSDVWGSTKALVFYRAPAGSLISPTLGRTFVWDEEDIAEDAIGTVDSMRGLIIEEYDLATNDVKIVRAKEYLDPLLLNKDAGHLITGV